MKRTCRVCWQTPFPYQPLDMRTNCLMQELNHCLRFLDYQPEDHGVMIPVLMEQKEAYNCNPPKSSMGPKLAVS